jgi:ethylbenzene dioxygenase subunit alpha
MKSIEVLVRDGGAYVNRQVFSDAEIYRQELENVFGRAWQFVAHDTQLPNPGDFLTTFMGEDPVLVIRQEDGSIRAFLNACSHRGPLLCMAEEGNAKNFTCPYHGWVFGADGALVQVPREDADGYHYALDKSQWGLRSIKVESYKGLYFANFDPASPPLIDYLGDFAWYLDAIFDPLPSGVEFLGGTMRQRLKCNWKIAAENIVADTYHVLAAHAVAVGVCMGERGMRIGIEEGEAADADTLGISATIDGHGFNAHFDGQGMFSLFKNPAPWLDYVNRQRPRYIERLGERRAWLIGSSIDGGVFPNFLFVPGFTFRL